MGNNHIESYFMPLDFTRSQECCIPRLMLRYSGLFSFLLSTVKLICATCLFDYIHRKNLSFCYFVLAFLRFYHMGLRCVLFVASSIR